MSISHEEYRDEFQCVSGSMIRLKDCSIQSQNLSHGDTMEMADGITRFCDDGVMKPSKCK